MCTESSKVSVWNQLRQRDFQIFAQWLTPQVIAQAAAQAGVALGRGPLNLANLVWLGIASALHTGRNFADVLGLVLKLLRDAPTWADSPLADLQRRGRPAAHRRRSRHDPRGQDPLTVSEEAFVQARQKLPLGCWVALIVLLADAFQAAHPRQVRWKQFRLLALDGTTLNLDRGRPLAEHFGTASRGRGRRQTQARLVLLEFPLARLPWRYELTPLADAEKTVAARLLGGLADDDLVLMDRGFWSYALFATIAHRGAFFALRRIAQAKLRCLRRLGRDDQLVSYRPSHWRSAWAERGWPRELTLRCITYQLRGFRPSAVVTNVLDPALVSRDEWVRLAAVDEAGRVIEPGLYHRRWEIEISHPDYRSSNTLYVGGRAA
jgi:Transposase DDE domain